jgi:hypothetical protein
VSPSRRARSRGGCRRAKRKATRGDTFAHDTVENQIRLERLFAKVTQGEMSASERNGGWAEFLAQLQRETKVRYEPGYAPGS